MNYLYILSQLTPEVNFIVPDFDQYLNSLTQHFWLVIAMFFALILCAILSYYVICIMLVFWHRLTGYPYQAEEQGYTIESSTEA